VQRWAPESTQLKSVLDQLLRFVPAPIAGNGIERFRACCGALIAIALTGLISRVVLGPAATLPVLVAPMGASAVLLFAAPSSPLAQPWSIFGGNVVSALVGIACAKLIADPMGAAALAVPLAIAAMFALRCLHPPGGAAALTAVIGGPAIHDAGFLFAFTPVALNSMLMVGVALMYNNATRRRYPHRPVAAPANSHGTRDAFPGERLGFTRADLDSVLKQYNQVLDVSRDDLKSLFLQTEMHAYRRRFGEITCADIMSRDVVAVEFGTDMEEAWGLLRRHKVKALPVVDRARRVIGIVTFGDFIKHADLDVHQGFEQKLRQFIRRTRHTHSDKAEVVGQIMTRPVRTARSDMHIVELVPMLSDTGLHHIPIVDSERRLAGLVTQSDLIAALYRDQLVNAEAA
jgi:CBS domain-containing membrane protein